VTEDTWQMQCASLVNNFNCLVKRVTWLKIPGKCCVPQWSIVLNVWSNKSHDWRYLANRCATLVNNPNCRVKQVTWLKIPGKCSVPHWSSDAHRSGAGGTEVTEEINLVLAWEFCRQMANQKGGHWWLGWWWGRWLHDDTDVYYNGYNIKICLCIVFL